MSSYEILFKHEDGCINLNEIGSISWDGDFSRVNVFFGSSNSIFLRENVLDFIFSYHAINGFSIPDCLRKALDKRSKE